MVSLQFQYSTDGGSTFSTALALDCLRARVVLTPAFENSDKRGGGNAATICQNVTARYKVRIDISQKMFDKKSEPTNYETNWQTIQKWACAPIKRIYCPTANKLGWTIFDSATNTNYVVHDSEPEYEFNDHDDGNQTVRRVSFNLIVSTAYTF